MSRRRWADHLSGPVADVLDLSADAAAAPAGKAGAALGGSLGTRAPPRGPKPEVKCGKYGRPVGLGSESGAGPAPMSTLDPSAPAPDATSGHDVASGERATTHRLFYNSPEDATVGHGLGWTLVGEPPGGWCWITALAARGAGVHAGPRVAKAVAVRVLAQHGVTVEAWVIDQPADEHPHRPGTFVAVARPSTQPVPDPRRTVPPTRPLLRAGRRRGH